MMGNTLDVALLKTSTRILKRDLRAIYFTRRTVSKIIHKFLPENDQVCGFCDSIIEEF